MRSNHMISVGPGPRSRSIKVRVLIIGSGGREHALAWKIAQSPLVSKVYCAPGNAGIAGVAECVNIKIDDLNALEEFASDSKIDLTVVGPEGPLIAGIVDRFEAAWACRYLALPARACKNRRQQSVLQNTNAECRYSNSCILGMFHAARSERVRELLTMISPFRQTQEMLRMQKSSLRRMVSCRWERRNRCCERGWRHAGQSTG